jgi:ABC-type branched-subunit amino acid transport system ATPase component
VARYKLLAFSIGNFFIGLGGALYALMMGFVSPPDFDFGVSLIMLSVVILGGLDSIPGVVLGACLLIPLPERFRFLQEYRLLLYGLAIILMLLFRPRGLWPAAGRRYGLRGPAGATRGHGGGDPMSLFATRALTVRFGGLTALDAVDVALEEGEVLGLIGPNGSGKTTFFNAVTGLVPGNGEVLFRGADLRGTQPDAVCSRGIARTFQSSRLCLSLSVYHNGLIGMHARARTGLWDTLFRRGRAMAEIREGLARAAHLLGLFNPDLPGRGFDPVGDLPQIDRRRVEICRALAARPRLLLLDEPSAAMSPEETVELMKDLQVVRDEMPGLGLILIEHDMFVIEGVSQRVVAFNYGRKIAEGTFAEVARNDEVREAYLGRGTGRKGGDR